MRLVINIILYSVIYTFIVPAYLTLRLFGWRPRPGFGLPALYPFHPELRQFTAVDTVNLSVVEWGDMIRWSPVGIGWSIELPSDGEWEFTRNPVEDGGVITQGTYVRESDDPMMVHILWSYEPWPEDLEEHHAERSAEWRERGCEVEQLPPCMLAGMEANHFRFFRKFDSQTVEFRYISLLHKDIIYEITYEFPGSAALFDVQKILDSSRIEEWDAEILELRPTLSIERPPAAVAS